MRKIKYASKYTRNIAQTYTSRGSINISIYSKEKKRFDHERTKWSQFRVNFQVMNDSKTVIFQAHFAPFSDTWSLVNIVVHIAVNCTLLGRVVAKQKRNMPTSHICFFLLSWQWPIGPPSDPNIASTNDCVTDRLIWGHLSIERWRKTKGRIFVPYEAFV